MCVRLVKANDLDLQLFQFDYDLTFAVFLMNADKTIYGRYGSRSSVEHADRDMSLKGLAASLKAALELHQNYPANRVELRGKQPIATEYKKPEDYPALRGKYADALDYAGAVSASCLHCHQIREAERQRYRDAGKPIPDQSLMPYPAADVVGIRLDPQQAVVVQQVEPTSAAGQAGIKAGDLIERLAGQPVISPADVQWVLHHTPAPARLEAVIRRGETLQTLTLNLQKDWRRRTDIAWRVTSWSLRRMVTGGILFEPASDAIRRDADLNDDQMALVIKHLGQYGPHAAAKRAGFRKGDLIVSFDGKTENLSPSELLIYASQHSKPGDQLPVEIIRDGRRQTLMMPMQN